VKSWAESTKDFPYSFSPHVHIQDTGPIGMRCFFNFDFLHRGVGAAHIAFEIVIPPPVLASLLPSGSHATPKPISSPSIYLSKAAINLRACLFAPQLRICQVTQSSFQ
jgi:hypothetical protein